MNDRVPSPGLLTDRYELTMLASFVGEGIADRRAVFECFARRLPEGRRYGLLAGLGRLLPLIEAFRFDADEIEWLTAEGVVDEATADYLRDFRFSGDITGLREGDLYFPGTPVLTVEGTLGESVLLETLILSVLNYDTAVASAAARMVTAAGERPLIEMGSRRTHEGSAIAAARAAYVAGFAATSNLATGWLHGVPTVGTAAHAFTLAHESEAEAFRAQIATHGAGTTLLVDTYDTTQGIRTAVEVAQESGATGPGAVRLDSGDLADEARNARSLLDELGAHSTRITVTSDLDEYLITALADAPIDGYGAGTRVVTGSGHPTAGMVYKLVSIEGADGQMRPVAKKAVSKGSVGGRKTVWRTFDEHGTLVREIHAVDNATVSDGAEDTHVAQVPLVRAGCTVHQPQLTKIREHAAGSLARLPLSAHDVSDGAAAIVPEVVLPASPEPLATAHQEPEMNTENNPRSHRALIIVDVQNDFVEGGSLAVTGGRGVASRISEHLASSAGDYDLVVATRDWHTAGSTNGGHFADPGTDPDFASTWPVHCLEGDQGSDYAPELVLDHVDLHVRKGMGEAAYSGFEGVTGDGSGLASVLTEHGIVAVDVVGIATDYCVRATALDAVAAGFRTHLLPGLHAGVAAETSRTALAEMAARGVHVAEEELG